MAYEDRINAVETLLNILKEHEEKLAVILDKLETVDKIIKCLRESVNP